MAGRNDGSNGDASSSGTGGVPVQAARLAVLCAALVGAAVLASWAATTSAASAVLAAVLAGGVAGIVAYGAVQSRLFRPFARLLAAAGLPGEAGVPELEAAIAELRRRADRLQALEAQTASLRHDLRGVLSPALLTADRLTGHEDPKVVRTGEVVIRAINRATDRLAATKDLP